MNEQQIFDLSIEEHYFEDDFASLKVISKFMSIYLNGPYGRVALLM